MNAHFSRALIGYSSWRYPTIMSIKVSVNNCQNMLKIDEIILDIKYLHDSLGWNVSWFLWRSIFSKPETLISIPRSVAGLRCIISWLVNLQGIFVLETSKYGSSRDYYESCLYFNLLTCFLKHSYLLNPYRQK